VDDEPVRVLATDDGLHAVVKDLTRNAAARAVREPNHELTFAPDQSLGADHQDLTPTARCGRPHYQLRRPRSPRGPS